MATLNRLLCELPLLACKKAPLGSAQICRAIGTQIAVHTTVDKLNNEINAGLADPKLKARLANLGGRVFVLSPADFGKFITDDTEKWGKVIRAANIKAAE
jgi:tripartite-type tricarboxylate transporter receptor subunit TctC